MNSSGFIVIHRQLTEWKYFQFPHALALWVHLLLRANWKTGWFLGVEIPRGALATSIQSLASETGMDVNTVRKWLKRFEEDGQITRKTTNRFTLIFISNYATFQDIPSQGYSELSSEQHSKQSSEQNSEQSSEQSRDNRTYKQSNKNNKETNSQTIERETDLSIFDLMSNSKAEQPQENSFESFASWNNIPSLDMIAQTVSDEKLGINPEKFYDYYTMRDWKIEGKPIRDWRKLLRSWSRKENREQSAGVKIPLPEHFYKTEPETTSEDDDEVIRQIKEMQALML